MAGVKAIQVPAMVAAHQDYLRTHLYQRYVGGFIESAWRSSGRDEWIETMRDLDGTLEDAAAMQGRQVCQEESDHLNIATLFHVADSMLEVAKHAAVKLDDFDRWSPEIYPAPSGFMVFEQPLLNKDVWGHVVAYNAVSWKRVPVPGTNTAAAVERANQGHMPSGGEIAFLGKEMFRQSKHLDRGRLNGSNTPIGDYITTFHFYTDINDVDDEYNRDMRAKGILDSSLGRWMFSYFGGQMDGGVIGPMEFDDNDEVRAAYRHANTDRLPETEDHSTFGEYIPNSGNLFRIMYSIFELMNGTVASISEETDRRLARRIRGKHRPPPMVTVIRLRRPETFGEREEGTGAWLTYRSVTRAHWRRQHYADGTVRRIYIHAYFRGPKDAPLWQPARVTTLER